MPADFTRAAEVPDSEYPFVLITGRLLEHWHTGAMTRRANVLDAIEPVATASMHPDDMQAVGIAPGGSVRVRSEYGEAMFTCVVGKVPQGMIFVPYGPPTCILMGRYTDGTGMPTSKGWEVEVEPTA